MRLCGQKKVETVKLGGASFKDLGKKCFAITKMDDNNILQELLNKLKRYVTV